MERKTILIVTFIMIFTWMPEIISGVVLPLKLKSVQGEAGAKIYGYLSSFNGLIVILFTPLFTMLLKKLSEIPKLALGSLLSVGGLIFYMLTDNSLLLFGGMFFITLGEIVNVLGSNPYLSKRVPLSHRGRINGIVSVMHSIFIALTQYLVSALLFITSDNYSTIFLVFIIGGVVFALISGLVYKKDKDTFPLLYEGLF